MKKTTNKVFIATSLDGYIADKDGNIDWLDTFPEINTIDSGYNDFIESIDALVMGRNTFETVCNFDLDWPYTKPVFVLSNSLKNIPKKCTSPVEILQGNCDEILETISAKGYKHLYIDGGQVIQTFLKQDLIDELVITVIPILLGSGIPLFADIPKRMKFVCNKTSLFADKIAQQHYIRLR